MSQCIWWKFNDVIWALSVWYWTRQWNIATWCIIPTPLIFPNPLLGVECIELRGTTASRPPLPLPPQPHKPQIGGGYSPVFNTAPPIIACRPFNIARFRTNHIITSDTSVLLSEHKNSEISTLYVSQDSLKQMSMVIDTARGLFHQNLKHIFLFFKRCKALLLHSTFPNRMIFQVPARRG